jgi:hypothetical protein
MPIPSGYVSGQVVQAVPSLAGKILQIVSTTKTDTFTTSSTSFTDITGLSLSITPSSSASTILLSMTFGAIDVSTAALIQLRFVRNSTAVGVGAVAGSRTPSTIAVIPRSSASNYSAAADFIDSPATTSAITYKVQMRMGADTGYLNRDSGDLDLANAARTICTLTAMEISA